MIQIVIAGVGGQGTLLASKILGALALKNGYEVRVSEVHGMSQRGGSVMTYVRMSDKKDVYASIVEQEQADVILAFESLEALRALPLVKKGGTVIVNTQEILPMPVISGAAKYPPDCLKRIGEKAKMIALDATDEAIHLGTARAANMVLLGVLSTLLPFCEEAWTEAIKGNLKPSLVEINLKAFARGRALA